MISNRGLRAAIKLRVRARWAAYDLLARLTPQGAKLWCPLCHAVEPRGTFGVHSTEDRFFGGNLVRHQCPKCDVIFGTQQMLALSATQLDREYRDLYSIYEEGETTDAEIASFECMQPKRGGVYLNYGSGRWSQALTDLCSRGYEIYGFEPYSNASRSGPRIITRYDELQRMRFDGIMSNNLIEHLQDPVETFTVMRRLLKEPESTMVHTTPCYRYEYEYSRFHLFFFVGRSAAVLAERSGMQVEETESPDMRRFRLASLAPRAVPRQSIEEGGAVASR